MTATIIILGATGDLTSRYLLPGLAQLAEAKLPPGGVRIVGVSNVDLDDAGFAARVRESMERNAGQVSSETREALVADARYVVGDVTRSDTLTAAFRLAGPAGEDAGADDPVVLYLALPHGLFDGVITALGQCELPAGLRVVVEKPFGEDLAGAQRLNAALLAVMPGDRIFRVDHFLAKQTVLNVIGLRFANRIFEPLWSSGHITSVDIVFDETVDAQSRGAYYDHAGALRDMVQNHLLQLLTFVAMEPPLSIDPEDLASRKIDVLRAVRPLSHADVDRYTVRGRYTAGEVTEKGQTRQVAAYTGAKGVDPARNTETYAEITLHLDTWRWAGVPFRLRTGKALARRRREIVVRFADVPHPVFPGCDAEANELRLELDPDRMSLRLNINGLGDPFDLEQVDLDTELTSQDPSPYGQLLLAIIEGDTRLSAHALEAEESWRIIEPVLKAWSDGASPLREYAAGTDGPT